MKLKDTMNKFMDKLVEKEFIEEVKVFTALEKHEKDYYNELLRRKHQLHIEYNLVSATNQIDLEDYLWRKIKDVDLDIGHFTKKIRGVA